MKKPVSIRDVARAAGVSITAVSQVLNQTGKISAARREHVRAVVAELGYVPVPPRKRVARRGSLAVLLPSMRSETFLADNPYFGEVVAGISEAAYERGYETMLVTFAADEALDLRLHGKKLAGCILLGHHPSESLAALAALALPGCMMDTDAPVARAHGLASVAIDDEAAAALATRHLLALGHRRIALAESAWHRSELQQPSEVRTRRRAGYRAALAEAGVAFDDGLVFAERLLPAGGHRLGQRLLAERPDVTAVFATSDVLALGLLRACHEAGRRVPEEFAVVGFDDLNSSAFTTPSLATIDQDMRGKGRAAATLVLDQIEGQPARHLVLPVRFVARESAPEVNNEVNTTARKGRPR